MLLDFARSDLHALPVLIIAFLRWCSREVYIGSLCLLKIK